MKIFKHILLSTILFMSTNSLFAQTETESDVIILNKESFLEKVYNYEKNTEAWVYEGDLPCIIDFYADWCMPCKQVSPILKELAGKYKGQIIVYQINVDKERELATAFGVRSIPAFLFVPKKGTPQSAMGAMPRESFVKAIEEFLLKENSDTTQAADQ